MLPLAAMIIKVNTMKMKVFLLFKLLGLRITNMRFSRMYYFEVTQQFQIIVWAQIKTVYL